jgi:hypothetical protein
LTISDGFAVIWPSAVIWWSFVPSGRHLAIGRQSLSLAPGGRHSIVIWWSLDCHWMVIGSLIQTSLSGNYYSYLHRIAQKLDTRKIQGTFDCGLRRIGAYAPEGFRNAERTDSGFFYSAFRNPHSEIGCSAIRKFILKRLP